MPPKTVLKKNGKTSKGKSIATKPTKKKVTPTKKNETHDSEERGSSSKNSVQSKKVVKLKNNSESSDESSSDNESDNDEPPVIVKLAMDTTQFKKDKGKKKEKLQRRLSDSIFENDIPRDTDCTACSRYEKENSFLKKKIENLEKQSKISKGNSVIVNKPAIINKKDGKKFKFESVTIVCRNCMEYYDNVPCPLIDGYNDIDKCYAYSNTFCTIGCSLYYNETVLNDSLTLKRKSLTIHVFKLMLGDIKMDIVINSAPPLERLKKLGGDLTINQYRKKSMALNQKSIMYLPPMKPINIMIEERIDEQREFDDEEYVLKRKKPINKKSSIQNLMKKGKKDASDDESGDD